MSIKKHVQATYSTKYQEVHEKICRKQNKKKAQCLKKELSSTSNSNNNNKYIIGFNNCDA